MAPKKIGQSSIIGEKGIAVIRRIVLVMGFMFYETRGVEAGIDGFIELRDEASGQVGNLLLQIQGKATERQFPRESSDSFEWPCDEDDIAYWLHGTAPVILIVVRTTDDVESEGRVGWSVGRPLRIANRFIHATEAPFIDHAAYFAIAQEVRRYP